MKKFRERFVMYLASFTPLIAWLAVHYLDWYPYEIQRVMFDGWSEGALFLAGINIIGAGVFLGKLLWFYLDEATIEDWALVLMTYFCIFHLSFILMGVVKNARLFEG